MLKRFFSLLHEIKVSFFICLRCKEKNWKMLQGQSRMLNVNTINGSEILARLRQMLHIQLLSR